MLQQSPKITEKPISIIKERKEQIKKKETYFTTITKDNKKEIKTTPKLTRKIEQSARIQLHFPRDTVNPQRVIHEKGRGKQRKRKTHIHYHISKYTP
jgi:hypothetical protein